MRKIARGQVARVQVAGLCGLIYLLLLASTSGAQRGVQKMPLDWARILVREVQPADNSYQHKQGDVKWKGVEGAQTSECHTDCSGLLNALLTQVYGFTPDDFEKWFGKRRPLAITYHEAILNQQSFKQIHLVRDARPGDVIAIQYPPDSENSGHCLLIAETPQRRQSSKPEVDRTEQWEVTVIDASRSGHGKTDTRRRDDGTFGSGVGQGVFRLYTDREGKVVGYAWSTFGNSEYYEQSARHLVIGRLDLPVKSSGR